MVTPTTKVRMTTVVSALYYILGLFFGAVLVNLLTWDRSHELPMTENPVVEGGFRNPNTTNWFSRYKKCPEPYSYPPVAVGGEPVRMKIVGQSKELVIHNTQPERKALFRTGTTRPPCWDEAGFRLYNDTRQAYLASDQPQSFLAKMKGSSLATTKTADAIVVDVGAGVGTVALRAASYAKHVYAVEGDPAHFAQLEIHIATAQLNRTISPQGVCISTGRHVASNATVTRKEHPKTGAFELKPKFKNADSSSNTSDPTGRSQFQSCCLPLKLLFRTWNLQLNHENILIHVDFGKSSKYACQLVPSWRKWLEGGEAEGGSPVTLPTINLVLHKACTNKDFQSMWQLMRMYASILVNGQKILPVQHKDSREFFRRVNATEWRIQPLTILMSPGL